MQDLLALLAGAPGRDLVREGSVVCRRLLLALQAHSAVLFGILVVNPEIAQRLDVLLRIRDLEIFVLPLRLELDITVAGVDEFFLHQLVGLGDGELGKIPQCQPFWQTLAINISVFIIGKELI